MALGGHLVMECLGDLPKATLMDTYMARTPGPGAEGFVSPSVLTDDSHQIAGLWCSRPSPEDTCGILQALHRIREVNDTSRLVSVTPWNDSASLVLETVCWS